MFEKIGGINLGNQGLKRYHATLRMPRLENLEDLGSPWICFGLSGRIWETLGSVLGIRS